MKVSMGLDDSTRAFMKTLRNIEGKITASLIAAERQAGEFIVEQVRQAIDSNIKPKNSPDYLNYKIQHGWDENTLLRTHQMKLSVSSKRVMVGPNIIAGHVGWSAGMRYGGLMHKGIYKRGTPKRRVRDVGRGKSGWHEFSVHGRTDTPLRFDTKSLVEVAGWMQRGARYSPPRPFLTQAHDAAGPGVVKIFAQAMANAMPISGLEEAPF